MNITTTLTAKGNSYLKLNLNCIKGQLEREWHCSTLVPLQHLRETGETHPRGGFITWGAEHRLHFTPVHPLSKTLRKQWPENNIAFQCLLIIPVKCIHSEQNILSYGYCKHFMWSNYLWEYRWLGTEKTFVEMVMMLNIFIKVPGTRYVLILVTNRGL